MKITDLTTTAVSLPLAEPLGNATATIHQFSCIVVDLVTDEGLRGENLIFTIRPEQMKLLDSMVHVLRDAVIGRDPDDTGAFWADAWRRINFIGFTGVSIMGISAIDGAMWDLRAKRAGLSISRMLGRCRETIPAYASGGLWLTQDIPSLVRQAEGFVAAGFKAMKLRLAGRIDVDLPRVKAVRAAIGSDIGLMIDANQVLDADAAIKLGDALAPLDIAWFEEPVPAHALEDSAKVARALRMPVASGENEYTRYGFRRMIEMGAASILMPDLQRVGGVTEFARVGALAASFDLPISSHLFPEMSLQLLAHVPTAHSLEYVEWFAPLYEEKIGLVDGTAQIPDAPGWGMSLDRDAIHRHAL
ncbi:mandelate racemase/muconate lactonizing enzyme family protein [Neorhizobium sp. BETTINA12A]|uniref:mandelate racemase/muconate lactonizing enzyme family protein n=1 Tax=Neorhizobium sp. BETTINA12A TaxID=2908924 RepID=UPI001FF2DE72|nr:mandelate racemase/muconate lactonizing enzyme family protein [Neorhizobium sp. BETTINA12A]MCJ9749536.1 mandelate racemase/muconate lactonizing enzyme family protein [Neorhizobium sp. BETTINA12A]